jgi:hypothetical protein
MGSRCRGMGVMMTHGEGLLPIIAHLCLIRSL